MEEGPGMEVWPRWSGRAIMGAGAILRPLPKFSGHTTTQPSSIEEEGFSPPTAS